MADKKHVVGDTRDHIDDSHHAHRALERRRRPDVVTHIWPGLVVPLLLISGPNPAREPCARRRR
jgi:hypothetical protein